VQWPQDLLAFEACVVGYDGAVGMMSVRLKCLAGSNVAMAKDCIGAEVDGMVNGLKDGEVKVTRASWLKGGCLEILVAIARVQCES
jgi:hypothetical protein